MNSQEEDLDVYGLVTELSKHLLETYRPPRAEAYCNYGSDGKLIKNLRSKAFGILLNKTGRGNFKRDYDREVGTDPTLEVLKYAFVLRLGLGRAYDAAKLEQLMEELVYTETRISSILCLLLQLKSFKTDPNPIKNIFRYADEDFTSYSPEATKNVPAFLTYPTECFVQSDKFEATLQTQKFQSTQNIPISPTSKLSFQSKFKSLDTVGIESIDDPMANRFVSNHMFNSDTSLYLPIPSTRIAVKHVDRNYTLLPEITAYDASESDWTPDGGLTTSCLYLSRARTELMRADTESTLDAWKSSGRSLCEESDCTGSNFDFTWVWNIIDPATTFASYLLTWESLGYLQSTKEVPFLTDVPNAAVHLTRMKETMGLPLLSRKVMKFVPILEVIPAKVFLDDVKSLLLGVESDSFEYTSDRGFTLRKYISVYGVGAESLEIVCKEAIHWGNCFRFLSSLVTIQPQTGKLQQEGLIFKAMCTDIEKLLLYCRAALLRIFISMKESYGLVKLLGNVRPVAVLISEVARLCGRNEENRCTLGEGNGILTHIYSEVIKVTDSKVALVCYSILKSCCEVYFRFLQKWMFEGLCDDVYGEFMIKTRPQYLRNRGHKFWTKSFTVCNEAVPGFLSGLTESILQCGKTVRLLRICDSKNPVCSVCVSEQPDVRVCLSVAILREQANRCRQYEKMGKAALGPVVSLSTAIRDRKEAEKETADLVIHAQRNTLLRINDEREDHVRMIARNKRDFLTSLKDQATKMDLRRRQEREDELRQDRSFLQRIEREEKVAQEARRIERTNLCNYYEDLANDIEKRRLRSHWRTKRMEHYEKRIAALAAIKRDLQKIDETDMNAEVSPNANTVDQNIPLRMLNDYQDENKNFLRNDLLEADTTAVDTIPLNRPLEDTVENFRKDKLPTVERPTFLNFGKIDNTAQARPTRMTGTPQDYDMTPNNNQLKIACTDKEHRVRTRDADNENLRNDEKVENSNLLATGQYTRGIDVDGKPSEIRNYENELETPMSCTTDNFASSLQSPMSQMQNSEDGESPADISGDASNSSRTRKFIAAVKDELTFPGLFATDLDGVKETPWASTPDLESLTVDDVDIIDRTSLQVYLEKSIRIPLMIQSRLVNDAVIKYFLKEHDLLLHLNSLRSYFFLLNGEFAKSLTDSLYARLYECSTPVELFNTATLTNLLERALVNSFNNAYVNSELLSLSAIDTPVQLHISDPSALDCLCLNYKISWPLNIILDDTVMLQYGKVFKFLITSGRVAWVLQEDFNLMKRERKAATSEQYHKLQLYRHAMTQFMNALHNYLTCSVLHASWTEFERDLQNSLTVDQIYFSHVNYIKRILSRCMLNARGEKLRFCLSNIFKVILKFHNRLRSQAWIPRSTEYVHPHFKRLEEMYRAFCESRAYMAHVAFKLATSGYQPHLMHFLNALNINQMYDLTVKPNRT